MRAPSSFLSTRITLAILLVISIGVSLVFWPGHMDADALNQISEARTGQFNDWWAPVVDAMWRVLFLVHLSPGFVLLASTTVFILSTFELLRTVLPRGAGILVTIVIVAFPPVLGFLGALQRETWFGASVLASYALLARVQRGATHRPRLMAVLALLAVWFAMAARQDAVIAVLPAMVIALGVLIPRFRGVGRHFATARSRKLPRALLAVVGVVAITVVFAGSQWVIEYPILGTQRTYPLQDLEYLDLANISLMEGKVLIPPFVFPAQSLAVLGAHDVPPRSSVLALITGSDPPLKRTPEALAGVPGGSLLSAGQASTVQHDWLSALEHYPGAYLRERWNAWLVLISWGNAPFVPYLPGFAQNPWGYNALIQPADQAGTSYLAHFTIAPLEGGTLFHVWPYMILGTAVSIDLLRRRRPAELRLIGAMSGFAIVYYLGYFFLAPGNGFRYAWYMVAATVIATVIDLVAHGRTLRASRLRAEAPSRRRQQQGAQSAEMSLPTR